MISVSSSSGYNFNLISHRMIRRRSKRTQIVFIVTWPLQNISEDDILLYEAGEVDQSFDTASSSLEVQTPHSRDQKRQQQPPLPFLPQEHLQY